MKDFLHYLPLIAVAGVIGYVFFKELIIIAIIILFIIFRNEVLGLCILVYILAIPYGFFTDSNFRGVMFTLALFFGGIFLISYYLADKYEKRKENSNTDSAKTKSEQVYRIEELQNQFEKWLIAVENAKAENKWKYGRDYERYVGYLFEREGFSVIYNGATKGSSDGGIDLFCFKDGIVYPIQCKRWKKKVDEEEIDKFVRAVAIFKRNRSSYSIPLCYSKVIPIFYTTSGYTDYAMWKAHDVDLICRVQRFNSIREYPAVKCTLQNRKKVYYLPFDKDFDSISVGVYRGGCYKFSVLEAEKEGFHYHKGLPLENKIKSSSEDWKYWQGDRNFPYVYFNTNYWEYVDLKSCKITYRNAVECFFTANFIGVINNTPPKVVKRGEILFRQLKSNRYLPEFHDDQEHTWIVLPKNRKKLNHESYAEYMVATIPFRNNMFEIVYRQLFKCDYIDPR